MVLASTSPQVTPRAWPYTLHLPLLLDAVSDIEARRILLLGPAPTSLLAALYNRFPSAHIVCLDEHSPIDCPQTLRDRVTQYPVGYQACGEWRHWPDLILCVYRLSDTAICHDSANATLLDTLQPGGHIAILDIYDTAVESVGEWLENSFGRCVRPDLMDHLQPHLCTVHRSIHRAYLGLWKSFVFVGRSPDSPDPLPQVHLGQIHADAGLIAH